MTKYFLHALLCLCLLVPMGAAAEGAFSRMVVLGDSLSDTGNLASVVGPFPFPFFENSRASDGPVAVEILAKHLGIKDFQASLHLKGFPAQGTNYAVAGANALADDDPNEQAIALPAQLAAFLLNEGGVAPSDALYVVFIGGNDVRNARDETNLWLAFGRVIKAVGVIEGSIRALVEKGARKVLVINVPDIGRIPETLQKAAATGDMDLVKRATLLTRIFNAALSRRVRKIERDLGIDLVEFDVFDFVRFIRANGDALEYTNTEDPCLSSFPGACDFNRYVFFDGVHPTGRTHERAARAFFAFVPEPGS